MYLFNNILLTFLLYHVLNNYIMIYESIVFLLCLSNFVSKVMEFIIIPR